MPCKSLHINQKNLTHYSSSTKYILNTFQNIAHPPASFMFFEFFLTYNIDFRYFSRKFAMTLWVAALITYRDVQVRILLQNFFFVYRSTKSRVIVFMIMLTRSSERICNPMRYTGGTCLKLVKIITIYDYAHSFFGEDF